MSINIFRKSLLAFSAAVAITSIVGTDAFAQKRGGNLVFANVAPVSTIDPHVAIGFAETEAAAHIYEGLVEMAEDYSAKPMLASKVSVNSDATEYTFALRRGVKFHNGKEMTSADVIGSFERYKKLSPNASILLDVASMATPDPYTFVVKLSKPNALLLEALKSPTYPLAIIPAELKDVPAREITTAVGTGPFQVQEWQRDSHLTLRRFDGYVADESAPGPDGFVGKKTVWLDTLRYNSVPEANTRIAALQSGQADFIAGVPNDARKRLDARSDTKTQATSPYCQVAFVTHAKNPPTSNNRGLRQAISALVDSEEMMEAAGMIWERNHSLMFNVSPYYSDIGKPFYDRHSVETAKALLKAGNYNGEKVVLETSANYAHMRDVGQVLVERLKAAGVNIELKMVDWTTNIGDLARGTGGWNISINNFCSGPLLGPQQWPLALAMAQTKEDAFVNDSFAKLYATTDAAERKKVWQGIEKYFLEEGYFSVIGNISDLRGMNDKWVGLKPYYLQRFWDVWAK